MTETQAARVQMGDVSFSRDVFGQDKQRSNTGSRANIAKGGIHERKTMVERQTYRPMQPHYCKEFKLLLPMVKLEVLDQPGTRTNRQHKSPAKPKLVFAPGSP